MDAIFDWCVQVLITWAGWFGITYKEINVWVFVILWPIATVLLLAVIVVQYLKIQRLMRQQGGR